jgi:hypothetical protein
MVFLTSVVFSELNDWSIIIDLIKNNKMDEARENLAMTIVNGDSEEKKIASEFLTYTYRYPNLSIKEYTALLNISISKLSVNKKISENLKDNENSINDKRLRDELLADRFIIAGDYEDALDTYLDLYQKFSDDENSVWFLYNAYVMSLISESKDQERIKTIILEEFPDSIPAKMLEY